MPDDRTFEWDDAKAASSFVTHRIEFSYATIVFLDPRRADLDVSRIEDDEVRRKVIGVVEGRLVTVVYTVRKETIQIISARRSNTTESKLYGPFYT
jgi:uncharacterized DUF497 family protein